MDENGEFTSEDPEWNAQARLENKLLEFCQRMFGKETAVSTLRIRLPAMLQGWRDGRSET
jgi:hypothetical protein